MSGYLPLKFVQDKIKDLENAIFFSMNEAVLKIPTCVVKILDTDMLGQLWFVIPRPSQFIHAFDKTFPVKLDFSRKGREFFLKINGTAFLVQDPEEINHVECLSEQTKKQAFVGEAMLVKVKMLHAEYTEKAHGGKHTWSLLNQVKQRIYQWFHVAGMELGYDPEQRIPAHVNYHMAGSFSN